MKNKTSEIAYRVLREKPSCNLFFKEIDFFECSRFLFFDIIGRAYRQNEPNFEFEKKYIKPFSSSVIKKTKAPTYTWLDQFKIKLKSKQKKKIWIPVPTHRLSAVEKQLKKETGIHVVEGVFDWDYFAHANQKMLLQEEKMYVDTFLQESIQVLESNNLTLLLDDKKRLEKDLVGLAVIIKSALREINQVKPNVVLTHTDNHPPYIVYTLIARHKNIPVFMVQHGLDCEHFVLDEAYATHVAIWGEARYRRYKSDSTFQPQMMVCGNPEYDKLKIEEKIKLKGNKKWLWLMRPHASEKCYSPARKPYEALAILSDLVSLVQKHEEVELLIKPHPFTNRKLYTDYLDSHENLKGKVKLCTNKEKVNHLILESDLVFSEDSTTLLDTCILGKPLVHLNYSGESSTVNTNEGKVCWYANNSQSLESAVNQFLTEDEECVNARFDLARKSFIYENAFEIDGKSTERVVLEIKKIAGI